MIRTAHSRSCRAERAARGARCAGLARSIGLVLALSVPQPAASQATSGPALMAYDLTVREAATGRAMRVTGNMAAVGGNVLIRTCVRADPFAPMLCQLSANGEMSPPMPMPPMPGLAGPIPGMGGAMPGMAGLDALFSPPPGMPGWTMRASGSGQWMGMAARGTFSYWQPRW